MLAFSSHIWYYNLRLVGQEAKTPPSHGGISGSIPLRLFLKSTGFRNFLFPAETAVPASDARTPGQREVIKICKKRLQFSFIPDIINYGSLVKRLRRRPLTAESAVRFRYELFIFPLKSCGFQGYFMPACRNGRRGRLKICCRQLRVGSSPTAGIE